ncbi:nuclear protein Es2-domain-containing protein [Chytriomyces sp. MP71]|nr:nuclear protein Es2-domain-containing protein [Chytriomyces sp. MP71]
MSSNSSAVVASQSRAGLLQPLPPPKRASVALEEDEYIGTVSAIIERDFFPQLKKMKAQNAFLDAVEAGDVVTARVLGERLRRMDEAASGVGSSSDLAGSAGGSGSSSTVPHPHQRNHGSRLDETPVCTGFTPFTASRDANGGHATPLNPSSTATPSLPSLAGSGANPDPEPGRSSNTHGNLSLDAFQATYTSEDNISFARLMDAENEARKQKFAWFFGKDSKGKLVEAHSEEAPLLIEAAPNASIAGPPAQASETSTAVSTFIAPQPPVITATDPHLSKKVDTWKYTTKNALMYYPDAAPLTLADVVNPRTAKLAPKSINHAATRIQDPSATNAAVLRAASDRAAERLATQDVWRNMAAATPALFNANSSTGAAAAAPNFGYVPNTPSLEPHADIDPEELFTWGMIDGTPLLVDSGADHTGTASASRGFRIPDTPKRDVIADRLAEKAKRDMKARAEGRTAVSSSASTSAAPGFKRPLDRLASPHVGGVAGGMRMLSPAAQKLLGKSGLRTGGGLFGGGVAGAVTPRTAAAAGSASRVDMQLRASYSPSGGFASRGPTPKGPSGLASLSASVKPSPLGAGSVPKRTVATPVFSAGKPSTSSSTASPGIGKQGVTKSKTLTDNLLDF